MSEITELLNKAAAGELQATIQYMWQHVMVHGLESPQLADILRDTAIEEMKHYEKIAERLDYLGVAPTTQPDPIAHSKSTAQVLKDDIKAETDAIKLYKHIIEVAAREKDYATVDLFEDIEADEEDHHHAFLTIQK
ncbi:MAG TPA: ferritin-like domain-containing protein [Conexivisphaerales archaeon]|nr:ferritin-like domain-containing protein [Conexivisphaerales archaeon]